MDDVQGLTSAPPHRFEVLDDPHLPLTRTKPDGTSEAALCWLVDGKVLVHPERRALFELWIAVPGNAAAVRDRLPETEHPPWWSASRFCDVDPLPRIETRYANELLGMTWGREFCVR